MRLKLQPSARLDLAEAKRWYAERNPDLATSFGKAVNEVLAVIREHPRFYPSVFQDVRRAVLHRFPYGIFYVHEETLDLVKVLAVTHHARDPSVWQERR